MADDAATDVAVAQALNELGRYEEVVRRFSAYIHPFREARMLLGEYEEVVRDCPQEPVIAIDALIQCGRLGDADRLYPDIAGNLAPLRLAQGRIEDAAEIEPDRGDLRLRLVRVDEALRDPVRRMFLLVALGRLDEVPENERDNPYYLIATDQSDRALALYGNGFARGATVRLAAGLDAAKRGDAARALPLLAIDEVHEFSEVATGFDFYGMMPFLRELLGERVAFARMRARFDDALRRAMHCERSWHCLAFTLDEIDEAAFRRQPYRLEVASNLLACRAVANERAGRLPEAACDYRASRAVSLGARLDVVQDLFVAWRLRCLADR